MLLRTPSETKNTVQHDITSNEHAQDVHIVCQVDTIKNYPRVSQIIVIGTG